MYWLKRHLHFCNHMICYLKDTLNVDLNNNKKFRSFKSKENIHKKEVGPYRGFGYSSLISDPLNLAKGARGKNY